MKTKILFPYVLLLIFSSCYSVSHLQSDELVKEYPETNPDKIDIYSTEKGVRSYSVVGAVVASADAGDRADIPVYYLKEQAAKMGADAIINLRLEYAVGYWSIAIRASGTAVKYKN